MFYHNDYEIIYLIREGDEDALSLMIEKYKPLISKKISKFNLWYDYDDMYQEAVLMLYKSLQFYEEKYDKTFTRYFELNLDRFFITEVQKRVRRTEILQGNMNYLQEVYQHNQVESAYYQYLVKEIAKVLTKEEYLVYTLRELRNYSIAYIKNEVNLSEKQIYNMLHRAKNKIKAHFEN